MKNKDKEYWILLYKKFLNWEWYDHAPTKIIFIHCLLNANWTDEDWRGQLIKRGQFPTSVEKLAIANGLTTQQTRTALSNLQSTNEINIQTTNRYSIITVNNWNLYQANNKQKTGANNKQSGGGANKQIGGSNNNTINNIDNTNNIYNISLSNKEKITKDEREILKNYFLSKKRKTPIDDIDAYLSLIIKNGDVQINLEKAKKWQERQAQKKQQAENIPPENEEKSSPEDEKRGLELLRNTVKKIRKGA